MSDQFEQNILLASLPPSQGQRHLALGIVFALLIAFVATAPFTKVQLSRIEPFIPIIATAVLINGVITSALLFAQFSIVRRQALLVLASGYLFSALMVIPYSLTFPGLFAPTGLLGAGLQSTVWLYIIWHAALPLSVVVYARLADADSGTSVSRRSLGSDVGVTIAVVAALVCAATWITTAQHELLPALFLDSTRLSPLAPYVAALMLLLGILALVLLWIRKGSVLNLWLMVVIFAWLLEFSVAALLTSSRFGLGWYMGRVYSLITASIVLIVLLSDTTKLYAQLARSVLRQRGTREARQIAMDAMAASIAHEVNQPITAMTYNSDAALDLLAKTPPMINEARTALEAIASDGVRVGIVIASLRAMFSKGARGRVSMDVNDLIREVLDLADVNLRTNKISISTELRKGLPLLHADKGQLRQVFLNLITNAIEAMHAVNDRARRLRITSSMVGDPCSVLVTVEDSGTGIDMEDSDRMFESFFTTKSTGTGIGLYICRSIIESHGGTLRAVPHKPYGAIFHVILPSAI
jgi:signal transduction histidine kinase